MSFSNESVIFCLEQEFIMITCGTCTCQFILFGVIKEEDGKVVNWIPQTSAYYCPYCGVKEE